LELLQNANQEYVYVLVVSLL